MMTNAAAAPDPVAAALAIIRTPRTETTRPHDPSGTVAVVALAVAVIFSFLAILAMLSSPATIPMWCAAHGGCP